MNHPATFRDRRTTLHADTCEPLKAAAERDEVGLWGWSHGTYPGRPLPREVLPELCSAGLWDAPRPQRWGLPWHCNEGIELTYLARGRLTFGVGEESWVLRPGQLTVTRPWQPHRVGEPYVAASRLAWVILDVGVRRPNQPWRWPAWLVCSPGDLQRLATLLRHNEQPVWTADEQCGQSFERLAALLAAQDPDLVATRLALAVNTLLVALLEMLQRREITLDEHLATSQRAVELFLAGLPDHLGQPWTLDEMAEACGLRRTQFSHYCRQITNMTPMEYLASCRVEAAARLLRSNPSASITEIAFEVGFQSSQYFATTFRARQGCSPRAFRAAHRNPGAAESATAR